MVDLKLVRNCPACNKDIFYSRKDALLRASKLNRKCMSCTITGESNPFFNKSHSNESIQKNSIWHKGRKMSDQHRVNTSKNHSKCWTGKKRDLQTRLKCQLSNTGKKHTEETKHKLRLSTINNIKKRGILRAFNFNGCKFIDHLNCFTGLNFQHALNGGEVELYGYFVDGYDKDKNIVFEYDEPHHYDVYDNLKSSDVKRQNNLIEKINPILFLRYDERNKRLYDAETNSTMPISI